MWVQGYSLTWYYTSKRGYMSRRPLTTFEDFSEARQVFDHIPTIYVFYASSYLALLQCNLVEHPLWIYGRTWILQGFLSMGNTFPSHINSTWSHTTMVQMVLMEGQSPHSMFTQGDRVVPPPHERLGLIHKVHSELGHFGIKRIYNLLAPHFHSRGMYAQVRDVIARCEGCDRVKTSFSSRHLMFFPLPIQGMFYCWSCDLTGELPQTFKGNVYIMYMIEHFSKWVELVALLDKSSQNTNHASLNRS
jgi:hypothetical protein